MIGPFSTDQSELTKLRIRELVDSGVLVHLEDQDIFPNANPEEFIIITNDPSRKITGV